MTDVYLTISLSTHTEDDTPQKYSLLSLRSSSSFLRLLPRLPVTYIPPPPFIFPLVTRCRRQFLHKM